MSIQKLGKTPTTTTNNYKGFIADKLMDYCNYCQPWKLDSGASEHYGGPNTGVRNRQKKRNEIKVQVTDKNNMDQVQERKAPFDGLQEDAADVQIFLKIPNPPMSCGKIVKKGYKIVLNNLIATIINKLTNEVVMTAEFDQRTSIWNLYSNKPVSYEFSEKQKVKSLGLRE